MDANRHGKMGFVCSRGPATPDYDGKRTADISSVGPADEAGLVKEKGVPHDPRGAPSATSHAFRDENRNGKSGRKAAGVAAGEPRFFR